MNYSMVNGKHYMRVPAFNRCSFWAWFMECIRLYNEMPQINTNRVVIPATMLEKVMRSSAGSIIPVEQDELLATQKMILFVAEKVGAQFIHRYGPYMYCVVNTFVFDEATQVLSSILRKISITPTPTEEEPIFDMSEVPLAVSRPSQLPPSWGPKNTPQPRRISTPNILLVDDEMLFHDTLQDVDLRDEEE